VRKNDPFAQIIYITTALEYALDSFVTNPIDYIIKPVEKTKLLNALNNAIQKVDLTLEKSVTIKTKTDIRTVSIGQIVYLEYVRHSVLYMLSNGEKIQTATIKESFCEYTQKLMQNYRFIQPHSAFIINMQYVERLNKDGFQLKGSYFVPISGKKYVETRDKYLNFRLEV
jgi:DNA-binding LytR/AlgR family response regulator